MGRKDVLRASLPDIWAIPKGPRIKPGGIVEICTSFGVEVRYASTCNHCQHITEAPTKQEMREKTNVCRGCMRMICEKCADKPCLPWEKQCEYQEREYLKRRIEDRWGCY
jgi:hypothetical protein